MSDSPGRRAEGTFGVLVPLGSACAAAPGTRARRVWIEGRHAPALARRSFSAGSLPVSHEQLRSRRETPARELSVGNYERRRRSFAAVQTGAGRPASEAIEPRRRTASPV